MHQSILTNFSWQTTIDSSKSNSKLWNKIASMIWSRKKEMGKNLSRMGIPVWHTPTVCISIIYFGCIVKCKANDIKTRDRSVWYYKRPSNPQSVRDVRTIVWLLFNMYKVKFCWKSHWKTGHSDIPLLTRCYPGEIHKELKSDFPLVQVNQMSVMEFLFF